LAIDDGMGVASARLVSRWGDKDGLKLIAAFMGWIARDFLAEGARRVTPHAGTTRSPLTQLTFASIRRISLLFDFRAFATRRKERMTDYLRRTLRRWANQLQLIAFVTQTSNSVRNQKLLKTCLQTPLALSLPPPPLFSSSLGFWRKLHMGKGLRLTTQIFQNVKRNKPF